MRHRSRCRHPFLLVLVLVLVLSTALPALPVAAATIVQVTDVKSDRFDYTYGALDDAGSLVVFGSTAGEPASNPLHAFRPTTVALPGGLPVEVTDVLDGARSVSVSDDGVWIACVADADPLGANSDRSEELFVLRSDGSDLAQLTSGDPPRAAWISGNGVRILFVGDSDPLGSNPAHTDQLFLVDRGGANLTQLTASSGAITSASISDDATRVVFTHDGDPTGGNVDGSLEVFAILSDGTDLRQLTANTSNFRNAKISGDGGTVVAESSDSTGTYVFTVFWDGTGFQQLAAGRDASIRDDGQVVFFSTESTISQVSVAGGVTSTVTLSFPPVHNYVPVVSGDGSRLIFKRYSYSPVVGTGSVPQLFVVRSDGLSERQLTSNTAYAEDTQPAISSDGTRIVFHRTYRGVSNGTNELWAVDADGGNLTQLTSLGTDYTWDASITGDGGTVVFASDGLQNGGPHIFRVQTDGSGLMRIDPGDDFNLYPDVAADGSWVVFLSTGNHTGGNPDRSGELFRMTLNGSDVTQITDDDGGFFKLPRVNANGQWVVYQEISNFDGENSDGSSEIFRARTDGSLVERLTADPVYLSRFPDLSADGGRIVWSSEADPLGANPDHNEEIFLYETATAALHQLTFTTSGLSSHPRITDDGAWVYFKSSAPFFESNPDGVYDAYRVSTATQVVERLGGLRRGGADLGFTGFRDWEVLVPNADGSRVVFASGGDRTAQNPDRDRTVWLVDLTAQATIRPGPGSSTPVAWDVEPGFVRYDVIRGDVASLQHRADSTVDLGPVVCLGDDMPDDRIAGADALQPAAGQVLFYLYRGTQGLLDGPGSYGQGSGGLERVPASGDCE